MCDPLKWAWLRTDAEYPRNSIPFAARDAGYAERGRESEDDDPSVHEGKEPGGAQWAGALPEASRRGGRVMVQLRACGGLVFVLDGTTVWVLRDRAVVALWRFASRVVAISEAAASECFLALDEDGRLETVPLTRDDRSAETKTCRLPYPSPIHLPLHQNQTQRATATRQETSNDDMFEQDFQLGRRPEQQNLPAAKRARTASDHQDIDSTKSLGQNVRASCAVCGPAGAVYCGRIDRPLVRCRHATGGLTIDGEGTDGGTRCLRVVGVDDADAADSWPGLVRIEPPLMGALCGMDLALLARPILLQGGADGCLRASAVTATVASNTIAQHTVYTLHEPIVCVLALRSAVVVIGAAGRLVVLTAGEDGRRKTYQRQLPGPIGSAVVLRKTIQEEDLSDMVLLITASRALYATQLQYTSNDGMSALHRLPLCRGVGQVAEGGVSEGVALLDDDAREPRCNVRSRLTWLSATEVLQHMRSGLYTLDAAWRSRQNGVASGGLASPVASKISSNSTESGGSGAASLRLKNILSEISMLNDAEKALEMQHKAANSRLAAVHGAVSALQLYCGPSGRPPRVGFRFKSVPQAAHNYVQDGVSTQIALEVLFDNPAASFALPVAHGSNGELWSLSVQLSGVEPKSSGDSASSSTTTADAVALGERRWNFSFGLPHGMERQSRLLVPLPADLVDLARRAPLQLSYHLAMQFGDGSSASAKAGFALPLYRQSGGGQSVIYRQADVLHFLHIAPNPARLNSGAPAAVPSRLGELQQLFHPAASALLRCSNTNCNDMRSGDGLGSRIDSGIGKSNVLELVMCGIQAILTEAVDSDGNSRHQVVVPPQPPACKVLYQILNDGGQGGAVVGALQAEMNAARSTTSESQHGEESNGLEADASVAAMFGPTGSMVRISVHRTLQTTPAGDNEECHTLAVYRLQMHANSLAVLALLHSALIHRAAKIDESAHRGWERLAAAVAPQPALSQVVTTLHHAQQQLQTQQQTHQQLQQLPGQQHACTTADGGAAAAAPSPIAALSLQHRRIAKLLSKARDQERPVRQKHEAMCDGESLAQLSSDLSSQATKLIEIWKALRTAVPL